MTMAHAFCRCDLRNRRWRSAPTSAYTALMATHPSPDPHIALLAGLLTSGEAARELHLSQDRVLRLLERRDLGGMRIANRWLLSPADLAAFRDAATARRAPSAPPPSTSRGCGSPRSSGADLRGVAPGHGTSMTAAAPLPGSARPSLYAQLKLIRKKLTRLRPEFAEDPAPRGGSPAPGRASHLPSLPARVGGDPPQPRRDVAVPIAPGVSHDIAICLATVLW